ncbi:MAG: TIGR04283 family arsenosugar biosynthesis glycosyltransferase [Candidatus Binatia bacterium]
MRISIIIPVLNEERAIGETLESIARLSPHEIIVVDGGSTDRTREVVAANGIAVVAAGRGRARQMNEGAKIARGDVLVFLHADTRLPASAVEDIRAALIDPRCAGGRFDISLDGDRLIFKMIGALISFRSRLTRVATGDQAIFVRREVFQDLGGFPDIPLMEDIALARALRKKGRIACLKSRVLTSARRWESEGVWRTIIKMWWLKFLYLSGISPKTLKRYYGDAR